MSGKRSKKRRSTRSSNNGRETRETRSTRAPEARGTRAPEARFKRAQFDYESASPVLPEAIKAAAAQMADPDPRAGAKILLRRFRDELTFLTGFRFGREEEEYWIYYFASPMEANRAIVTAAVRGYSFITNKRPHIVAAFGDDQSLLDHCENLQEEMFCDYTELPLVGARPEASREVPRDVPREVPRDVPRDDPLGPDLELLPGRIRMNTALVAISSKISSIDIPTLLENAVSSERPIPVHSDLTPRIYDLLGVSQSTAQDAEQRTAQIASFTLDLQRLGAPPGLTVLAVKNQFRDGYRLRLGRAPPNLPAVAGAVVALARASENRNQKNARFEKMQSAIRRAIGSNSHFSIPFEKHYSAPLDGAGRPTETLSRVVLVSDQAQADRLQEAAYVKTQTNPLDDSHVLSIISFSDETTSDDIKKLVGVLLGGAL